MQQQTTFASDSDISHTGTPAYVSASYHVCKTGWFYI